MPNILLEQVRNFQKIHLLLHKTVVYLDVNAINAASGSE